MKRYTTYVAFFLFLIFIKSFSFAQSNSTLDKHKTDSIQSAKYHEQFIQLKLLRDEFLKELDSYPSDSSFKLDISNLGFIVFPDISRFTHITHIQASGNQLTRLRLASKNIRHLKVLDIRDNDIKNLKIGRTPQLNSIYLNANPLQRIPGNLFFNRKLRKLDISNTEIEHLAWWMKYKRNLNELYINQGILKLNNTNIRRMRHLKTLLLAHLDIDSLPSSFSNLNKLERLTIGHCKLNSLPNNFGKLNNLHTLILYNDAFTEIPKACYQLKSLTHLDFYFNHLQSIPIGIKQLHNLKHLYLSFNQISILPPDIQELKHLQTLHIHHNNIEIAPQWLSKLISLQILDMGYNDIEVLPKLSSLDSLIEVDFQENKIVIFPFQFLEMPSIQLVFLAKNQFVMSQDEMEKLSQLSKSFANRKGQLILYNK
ncbi:MAG: leucine-rich repeat domain-containing protein [Bacteroidales bacterium]|nr:leucine-rich repeat domain-containing protein [Bacteroidales bacterium]